MSYTDCEQILPGIALFDHLSLPEKCHVAVLGNLAWGLSSSAPLGKTWEEACNMNHDLYNMGTVADGPEERYITR